MTKTKIKALLLAAAFCAATPAAAEEITASVWFPETHPLTRDGYMALKKSVEEASDGNLTMQVYTGTSLLPPVAHLSGLTDGIVQMTYHAGTYTPSDLPEDNTLAALAIGLPDSMTAALAVADFYINDPAMQEMFKRLGIVFLGSYASPQYVMMCADEVTTLDQVKGKKLRMPSPVHAAWAESVGAVPVNVPSSEMFTGLEKGQLDCAINAANDLKSRSLWDVAKYTTLLEVGPYFAGWEYAMAQDAWAGLSPENRQILIDAMPGNIVAMTAAYLGTVDEALAEAADHGVTVSEPAAGLAKSLADFVDAKVDAMAVETGEKLGAQEPEALIARFKETYAKWEDLLADIPADDLDAIADVFRTEVYDKVDVTAYGL
ncbi:C4-dicarboxylate TRAP transporter substrate-binding protein [Kaustia mangrovi]|uniref:C4-dicarboxylate TRAP transporter substrate-binding protein n=1 Tax=Kaustia mangrovi TaxID=2593653 RepID=A0A7S8C1P6_9HYPH|nr:C4-dicarboxylate TRAP transporter substrate-binding protein [Kaustia mangrovi]QPC41755.1 C4-dicarboxylate TRAP transporter substrate-binding protein [Kaustia mangrovi]